MAVRGEKLEVRLSQVLAKLFIAMTLMLLLASLFVVFYWLNKPENFLFKKIELVNQLENQKADELQKVAEKSVEAGFFSLNVADFTQKLQSQLPWVKSVSVKKIWPNKLRIFIIERKPIVRWISVEENKNELLPNDLAWVKNYQLLSDQAIVFRPNLTIKQKEKFSQLVLLFGTENSAKNVLSECLAMNKKLMTIGLGIQQCGMNKRRTWNIVLVLKSGKNIDIKLGKDNIMQQLERFIKIFSGQLKTYLGFAQYVDLRYSNGFSIKWNKYDYLQSISKEQE